MTIRRARTDDTGSIPLALVITAVGLAISALLLPIILSQINSSRYDQHRDEALRAAQAGLDVAIAQIRAATDVGSDGGLVGDVSKLPCAALTGYLSDPNSPHYRVTVDYFAFAPDPDDYLDSHGDYVDSWINTQHLACGVGNPRYALIRSQGAQAGVDIPDSTCQPTMRCLHATYTFTTENQSVTGGQIHVYKTATSNDLCLSANSGTLTAAQLTGTPLIVDNCDPAKPAQFFTYGNDLTVVLVGSKTSDNPGGMCLDERSASGQPVQFQPCAVADQATQQWVFNGEGKFVAADGGCLRVASPNVAASTVVHDTAQCATGPYADVADFSPDPAVGAGAAGLDTNQLVNYQQFGRCLGVPRQNYLWHTNAGDPAQDDGPYLVGWPCKQNAPLPWDQVWTLPGAVPAGPAGVTGLITTTAPNTDPVQGSPPDRYCLRSPASTAPLRFVLIVSCPTGQTAPTHTSWTVTGDTGDYSTSYTITDDSGYCLAPQTDAAVAADPYPYADGYGISKIVVQPCDGSALQKWDAPADLQRALPLNRIGEH